MSWKLTMDEINEYKDAFSIFDIENLGYISVKDIKKLMRSLGQYFSEEEFKNILTYAKLSDNKREKVEFHEFLDIMANHKKDESNSKELIKAFKYFDRSKDNKINYDDFVNALSTLNEKLSYDEVNELKDYFHIEKDRTFEYIDFLNLLLLTKK